jgi:hypothetical protein
MQDPPLFSIQSPGVTCFVCCRERVSVTLLGLDERPERGTDTNERNSAPRIGQSQSSSVEGVVSNALDSRDETEVHGRTSANSSCYMYMYMHMYVTRAVVRSYDQIRLLSKESPLTLPEHQSHLRPRSSRRRVEVVKADKVFRCSV